MRAAAAVFNEDAYVEAMRAVISYIKPGEPVEYEYTEEEAAKLAGKVQEPLKLAMSKPALYDMLLKKLKAAPLLYKTGCETFSGRVTRLGILNALLECVNVVKLLDKEVEIAVVPESVHAPLLNRNHGEAEVDVRRFTFPTGFVVRDKDPHHVKELLQRFVESSLDPAKVLIRDVKFPSCKRWLEAYKLDDDELAAAEANDPIGTWTTPYDWNKIMAALERNDDAELQGMEVVPSRMIFL
jgi:hypothetical protein